MKAVLIKKNGFQKGHSLMGNNPTSKGKKWTLSAETKEKMRLSKLGVNNPRFGKKMLPQTKKAILNKIKGNKFNLGRTHTEETKIKMSEGKKGEKHPLWKKDRNTLQKQDRRNDSAYREWRKNVYQRDSYLCKINNQDCSGRLEAHHILEWKEYPELRYNINNGITLCKHHHPRIKIDVKNMVEIYKRLINLK